ncbi:hypothetical protein ETD86_22740 [Nonomuraea turkmeniaca]|uniref:CU044_5270 family protein n=1 Tax=Nonomuraea turkmeniaca TaxID=103838 RepID=A0A5S4FFC0_9ACTN|nr:hypothetical protein [Nonomuraea turkmeniaca]TMR17943.1 hypothetical protein ETD86_22740 [Nonomuraea turkmeniaca]
MRTLIAIGLAALTAVAPTPPAQAAAEKKYWHTETVQVMTHPRQVGSGANKYWLVERDVMETWSTRDGRSWSAYRALGAKPKSAADVAAWKRDGSPKKWSYRTEGMLVELSLEPEKGRVTPARGGPGFILGQTRLTFEELQAAPTDPEGLKAWVQKLYSTPGEPPFDMSKSGPTIYENLMHRLPVPKGVREAAYKALSSTPGITVADAGKGRKKLTYRVAKPGHKMRLDYVIDTTTWLVVSSDLDTVDNGRQLLAKTWTMDIESGWTDDEPAVPAAS